MLISVTVTVYKLLDIAKHKVQIIVWIVNLVHRLLPSSLIVWMSFHLYYKLILINIVSLDLIMIRNHALISVVSIVILISTVMYFGFKHNFFSKMFIVSIDRKNNLSYTLTSLIKYTFLGWLLTSESTVAQAFRHSVFVMRTQSSYSANWPIQRKPEKLYFIVFILFKFSKRDKSR